ncbi:hypothetical protein SH501x_001124 [Pirellulaceae bacterium SH501]
MNQIVLKYRGFTWRKGTHYTLEFADRDTIDVYRPFLRPVTWMYGGATYKLKCGSNTSSALYTIGNTKIGEIHESCRRLAQSAHAEHQYSLLSVCKEAVSTQERIALGISH